MPKHILHIPRWYPNRFDLQLGIFIQKHLKITALLCDNTVLYAHPDSNISEMETTIHEEDQLMEVIVYYPSTQNTYRNLKNYRQALELGYAEILNRKEAPDLLHFHIHLRNILEGKRLLPKLPYIVTEHWSGFVDGRFKSYPPWKKVLIKRHLKKAVAVSVPGDNLQRIIGDIVPEQNVVQTPNLIEKSSENPPLEEHVLLSVGDLYDNHKNMSGLLRAFAESELKDWTLRIIGDGPDREMLERLAKELKLNERIQFLGRLPNHVVLLEMKKISFFVLNSNFESFGMVPAEALMAGKPCIGTICGGPEEYINDTNGILIEIGDHEALVKALNHMREHWKDYNSDKLMEAMVHKYGREAVKASFEKLYALV